MDSLTQIVLGAAVGEVVLGKKVGNRAMLWGAVAGTIPDLDVLSNFFLPDIYALAAHRGFSHSIVFAIISAPVFGWLVHKLYQNNVDRKKWYKAIMSLFSFGILIALWTLTLSPIWRTGELPSLTGLSIVLVLTGWIFPRTWRYLRTRFSTQGKEASWKEWSWLFFWCVFTHPLLDCFTTYGTQLFQPFSDYRVSFSTISVADPLYTVPFLLCLMIATYLRRATFRRQIWTIAGISLSSLYLLFTVWNKSRVNNMITSSLDSQGIEYSRYMSSPSIFNNLLWTGIAESDSGFYYGIYSVLDKREEMQFAYMANGRDLLDSMGTDRKELQILKWFSNGYYTVSEKDSTLFLHDMRFGVLGDPKEESEASADDFVFSFRLEDKGDYIDVQEIRDRPENPGDLLVELWTRIKGVE